MAHVTKRDYYETLGSDRNASDDEIKKAFRKLARQHHPDLHTGDQHDGAQERGVPGEDGRHLAHRLEGELLGGEAVPTLVVGEDHLVLAYGGHAVLVDPLPRRAR